MNVYLYVLDTLADYEIAHITAEIHSQRFLDKSKPSPNLVKIGNDKLPITTMGGMTITPDKAISEIKFNDGDILILPGADTWYDERNQGIIELAKELSNSNVIIAAICGATMALAQAGVFNTRKHTSNGNGFLQMMCPHYSGAEHYVDKHALTEGNLITANGIAPIEFAYELFKKSELMKPNTLESWYNLFTTKEAQYFFQLMDSIK